MFLIPYVSIRLSNPDDRQQNIRFYAGIIKPLHDQIQLCARAGKAMDILPGDD